jgi:RimJ/RimL family protein N-acetyltransferase
MYARLEDNTLLYLREIRPDDKERLLDSMKSLSEQSRQRRFLGPKPTLSPRELRYLTEVDGLDHYALVAVPVDDEERIMAVARFVRLADDATAAEAAITVCDDLQGKGLGSLLARRLTDAARERGIERLTASVSSENRPALKLMRRIDERLSGRVASSVTELVAQLPIRSADDMGEEAAAPAEAAPVPPAASAA